MEFKDVVKSRKSVRGFKNQPVTKEQLSSILEVASRAVSGKNLQPWEFVVLGGDTIKKVADANAKLFREGAPLDFPDGSFEGIYRERQKEIGIGLFKIMDIQRDDKEKRMWWGERGYRFFDAPAAILICMDESLMDAEAFLAFRLDMGCIIQNIILAATDAGLATCVEYQAIGYNSHYYDLLDIPKNKKFICGIAIGYEDPDFPANKYISPRESVENMTYWRGL